MTRLRSVARAATVTLAALAGFSVSEAFAFNTSTCLGEKVRWPSNSVTMRASPISFPAGAWRNALNETIGRWNLNPSRFSFDLRIESGVRLGNGQNEIWFSSDPAYSPAVAFTWVTCLDFFFFEIVRIDEADVIFHNGVAYTPSTNKADLWPYSGPRRPFQTTATHELGHALGLGHVNTEYNVMGQDWTHIHANWNTARAYPGEDASDGAVHLYGTRSPRREDVGVVHWKHSGASGEYSTHNRTRLYSIFGTVLPSFIDAGEPRFHVNREQRIQTEFSYENNGASFQSGIRVGYYISTNSLITTFDRRIGGATFQLARDNVFTKRISVTIPGDLSPGDYWLGVIIDETDAINEVHEWNNATYTAIRVN